MELITISYSLFHQPLESSQYDKDILGLPETIKMQCSRFHRWQDRQSCLMGKLLLAECLQKQGFSKDLLANWYKDKYGKPHISSYINFNISHSEGCVICAVSDGDVRIGIDIEKIKPINLSDFESNLDEKTIREMYNAQDPYHYFYRYWTAAESVIKADGRGFSIDLRTLNIDLDTNQALIDKALWYLTPLAIAPEYVCCLSSSNLNTQFELDPLSTL
jgi:4'-phosphopantetheinyl transferase